MVSRQQEIQFQQKMIETFNLKTCTNCVDWDKKAEQCGKWKQLPPPSVIVVGCDAHENDIPF